MRRSLSLAGAGIHNTAVRVQPCDDIGRPTDSLLSSSFAALDLMSSSGESLSPPARYRLLNPVRQSRSAPAMTTTSNGPWACEDLQGKVKLGVCAMDKKAKSRPMQEILSRLRKFTNGEDGSELSFQIINFGNNMILDEPVENWPVVDSLISFFSAGFPLEKALEYTKLHPQVRLVNDLEKQKLLLDRRLVYRLLRENSIPVSKQLIMSREEGSEDVLDEDDDWVEVNGERMVKPFVEKPFDADDHSIHIYYPKNVGGGHKRLFRKVGNQSSRMYPDESSVRREGSYIYEEFLPTEGTDVKVYTVGQAYAHAEARKSPALDGIVKRDAEGREVRWPVILSAQEKEIAYKVVEVFGQNVCGCDPRESLTLK